MSDITEERRLMNDYDAGWTTDAIEEYDAWYQTIEAMQVAHEQEAAWWGWSLEQKSA